MTSFDGDPSAGDAVDLKETTEAAEVSDETATSEVSEATTDEATTDEAADAAGAPDEPAEEVDPAVALKAELRSKPGDWYVIHSYAGYENKVKANLETRVQNLDVGDYIFQVEVPTEEVTEIKNGQRKQVNRKVLPGYILVRMDLTDDSWAAVRNTPGVTGFVGATSRPSALTLDDVVKFLLPRGATKKAAKGAATTATAAEAGGWNARPSRSTTRSANRSRSWTARSRRCRPRSARSTANSRNSRCWCRSSAARPRSN